MDIEATWPPFGIPLLPTTGYRLQWFKGATPGAGTAVGSVYSLPANVPQPLEYAVPFSMSNPSLQLEPGQPYYFGIEAVASNGQVSVPVWSSVIVPSVNSFCPQPIVRFVRDGTRKLQVAPSPAEEGL